MMRITLRCWLTCLALVATAEGFAPMPATPLPAAARAPGSCHSSWSSAGNAARRSPRCSVVQTRAGFLDSLFGSGSSQPEPANQAVQDSLATSKSSSVEEEWEELIDSASGSPYYWNKLTGETSWDAPFSSSSSSSTATPAEAQHSQTTSSTSGASMPALYDGWFTNELEFKGSDGETIKKINGKGELSSQMISAINCAMADGITRMEVSFPPVPNLEEVDFGTAVNQQFSNEIRAAMGVDGKEHGSSVRRNLVDFANHYWASRLSTLCGVPAGESVYIGHCTQTIFKETVSSGCSGGAWVGRAKQIPKEPLDGGDMAVCVNAGPQEQWRDFAKKNAGAGAIIFLNSISGGWTYELGGPLQDFEQVYYLKRVSKGWVFRAYPGKWQALVETPNGTCEILQEYDQRPLLRDVSKLVREYSFENFGLFNDRYAKGFGGRL